MFCHKCGQKIAAPDAKFCNGCGAPVLARASETSETDTAAVVVDGGADAVAPREETQQQPQPQEEEQGSNPFSGASSEDHKKDDHGSGVDEGDGDEDEPGSNGAPGGPAKVSPRPPVPQRPANVKVVAPPVPKRPAVAAAAAAAANGGGEGSWSQAYPDLGVTPNGNSNEYAANRARLVAFYRQHNPAKLQDPSFSVDKVLASYRGRETLLFRDLEAKYLHNAPVPPRPNNTSSTGSSSSSTAGGRARRGQRTEEFKTNTKEEDTMKSIMNGLKLLYRKKIRPLEEAYKFHEFHSPLLTDTDMDAKPMVLLLGQYSTGKTTFIKYLLEREFPGQRIGPEPTTDRFVAVMHGQDERVIPGNALAADATRPFTALNKFGMAFLNKFECAQLPAPILEKMMFIDTPGVLSGEKQRIGRSYDFIQVIEWFAGRADRILLLFDAHKLDISDEFKLAIEALKGHDDKIRVVLNKADRVSGQQLMRVYGALMWSLGKVIKTPEVLRVYIGSFWDQPYQHKEQAALFDAESNDLLADLRLLPRNASMRKINELIKRARMAKVHAYLIGHLRNQFGFFSNKAKTQEKLLQDMADHFRTVQHQQNLPIGDFPNMGRFRQTLARFEVHKFPKLDEAMIAAMDQVLSKDIPRLMKMLPAALFKTVDAQLHTGRVVNPFDDANIALRAKAQSGWSIDEISKKRYDARFHTLQLDAHGYASGAVVRDVLMESGLPTSDLRKIWGLADIDRDGKMDSSEFAVAMFLVEQLASKQITQVPDQLPRTLVPPNKRVK